MTTTEVGWLTDEQVEAIEATLPRCPKCGGDIAYVHMVAHELHRWAYEIDSATGDVLVGTRHYDTTFREAEQDFREVRAGKPVTRYVVECADGHEWPEERLTFGYPKGGRGEQRWEVVR